MTGPRDLAGHHPLEPSARSRLSLIFLLALIAAVVAGCGEGSSRPSGEAASAVTTAEDAAAPDQPTRPTADVDELVEVGHGRMHVRCSGAGDETVVLISGFTGDADHWSAVEPALASTTRACAYDRFGTGASDAPLPEQTFTTQAEDLRALLTAAGEPAPYVLVGHSFGGPAAVTFASRFADDVEGLLLLDASPPTWNSAICAVADDGSATARSLRDLCASQAEPANNPEHLAAPAAFAEVSTIASLGDLPMIVATAPARSGIDELTATAIADLNAAWNAGQEHWASLSTSGRLVTVDDTGHYIQDDQPAVVLDLIDELLS